MQNARSTSYHITEPFRDIDETTLSVPYALAQYADAMCDKRDGDTRCLGMQGWVWDK